MNKDIIELNRKADEKVHNELEQSSMIITIVFGIAGILCILLGLPGEDTINFQSIVEGIEIAGIGYIAGLSLRWMASVLRQLHDINPKIKD